MTALDVLMWLAGDPSQITVATPEPSTLSAWRRCPWASGLRLAVQPKLSLGAKPKSFRTPTGPLQQGLFMLASATKGSCFAHVESVLRFGGRPDSRLDSIGFLPPNNDAFRHAA